MINELPPLLVIATLPVSFCLSNLDRSAEFAKIANITKDSLQDLEQFEILIDGMSFLAEINDGDETKIIVEENCGATVFGNAVVSGSSSIGISLSEHLQSGKHIPTINKALLRLAKAIGEEVSATHIAWLPAQQSIGFGPFSDAVDDYVNGGPTPILVQVAIKKNDDGRFQTLGLRYFSEQEIALNAPSNMSDSDAIKRLVRIGHDIAVNGKIDNKLDAGGLEKGEIISYRPSPNLSELNITIAFS